MMNSRSTLHINLQIVILTTLDRRTAEITGAQVSYGLIPKADWYQPDWIDEEKYERDRKALENLHVVPYGGSMTYRNMCRYNSGVRPYLGFFSTLLISITADSSSIATNLCRSTSTTGGLSEFTHPFLQHANL